MKDDTDGTDPAKVKSAIAEIERQARAFRREAAILVAVDVAFLVIVLVMVSVAVWWTIRDGS